MKLLEADLELAQEDNSKDDHPTDVETLLEENDVIPEESLLEEMESEAHVTEAFLASWRAKHKTAGMQKGRGFQGQPSLLEESKAAAISGTS